MASIRWAANHSLIYKVNSSCKLSSPIVYCLGGLRLKTITKNFKSYSLGQSMLSHYWQVRYDIQTCFVGLGLSRVRQPSFITKTSNLPPFIEALEHSLWVSRIQCDIHNKMIWKKLAYKEHPIRLAHHLLDLDIWSFGDWIWSFQWWPIASRSSYMKFYPFSKLFVRFRN